MKPRLVKIGHASEVLNVSQKTLRAWEKQGFITPAFKSPAGTRFYNSAELRTLCDSKK
jgi:DNA-binding transcriptional MerR regulator